MPAEFTVHVNRDGLHTLSVPPSVEVHGPFDVRLVNHGEPLHVHLHLDDGLARVGSLDATNHYVEEDTTRVARVDVDESALGPEQIRGKLKVASGYGAETRWIDVDLVEEPEVDRSVTVDESLSKPAPEPEEPDQGLLGRPAVPVVALGVVALVVALVAIVFLSDVLVLAGALVVLVGVLVALYFLAGPEAGV